MLSLLRRLGRALGKLKQPEVWLPVLAIVAIVILAVVGFLWFRSWLVAVTAALAIALVVLVAVLFRTAFAKERAERIERGIEDRPAAFEQDRARTAATQGVEEGFRRAMLEIRGSRLAADGIYTLPWLLVIGESGSGKSALLRQSGLELPAEYAHSVGVGATQTCDWWLANQAIVLDTSGRLSGSDDPGTMDEWRTLLRLLRRTRPDCPLNGVIMTVPVTSLFGKSPPELEAAAHTLRRRINQLTDDLGMDLPIYVMVTKSDLIEGFVETVNLLPPDRLGEALGWTNEHRDSGETEENVLRGLDQARDRLEAILPELVLREQDPERRRRVFVFPQEFGEAARAVASFLSVAFAPSAYDEVPFLRGVYFCSARREGATLSPLLRRLGHEWAANRVDGSTQERGLFLRDVLYEVVLGDRDLAMPVERFGPRARRLTHALSGFAVAMLTVWWTISFAGSCSGISNLRSDGKAVIAGASSLATLDELRGHISGQQQRLGTLRSGGLDGNLERAIERAQRVFVWAFGREFESPTKARLKAMVRGSDDRSFEALAALAQDVTWLGSRANPETGAQAPDLLPYAPTSRNDSEQVAFREAYDDFVRWLPDDEVRVRIDDERDVVASAAARLLELRRLETWSERSASSYPPVRYADAGVPSAGDGVPVPGAYTRRGWEGLVSGMIDAIDRTGGASTTAVQRFRRGYVRRYDSLWKNYLLYAPTPSRAQDAVKDSPYVKLVEQIHFNTDVDLPRDDETPPWVAALNEVRRETPLPDEEPENATEPPWLRYQAILDEVAADVAGAAERPEHALELANRMADQQPTSFGTGLAKVRELVTGQGDPQATAKLEDLLSMPILNGASRVLDRALSELDRTWSNQIAAPYGGALNAQGMQALYGSGSGELDRFQAEALGRFYSDGRPRAAIGDRQMPFGPAFLAWMESAQNVQRTLYPGGLTQAPPISVRLQGIPSQVVDRSDLRVSRREIRMTCDAGVQTFVYREGTQSHGFLWSPDCTEVSLRIWALDGGGVERELLPRLTLENGPLALPNFLSRAQPGPGGRFEWTLRYEEPKVEVVVQYRLRGGDAILAVSHSSPPASMRN